MGVEGTASAQEIIRAVEQAGYGASEKGAGNQVAGFYAGGGKAAGGSRDAEAQEKAVLRRLGFLLVLMYISMGHMMWGWPLPSFFDGNHVAMGLAQLLLTVIVMVINQRFFISGFKSAAGTARPIWTRSLRWARAAAFVYSTYALFAMTGAQVRGDMDAVMDYMMNFYFESAAMILTLITVGKMLEARSKGKTTDALKSLMKLAPKTATVVRDGKEETVPIEQVQSGRHLRRPPRREHSGRRRGARWQRARSTRRRSPARASRRTKPPGDTVSAATVNQSGFLTLPRHARRARTRRSRRSFRWSPTRRRPKRQLPRLPTRSPACLSLRSFRLQLSQRLSGC